MQASVLREKTEFKGDHKNLTHFLVPYEKRFIRAALPLIPSEISTAHLTLMTIVWSAGIAWAGYMARGDIRWLWLFSACVFLQYITDMLDGAVGRARGTGLIKWGFYMDHLLDFLFLSSIVFGYACLLPPSDYLWALLGLAVTAGFMVHVLLDFAITNDFKISFNYIGVSEIRLLLIIINGFVMLFGKDLVARSFPFFVFAALGALCLLVYRSQKIYGHIDAIRQSKQDYS